MSSADELLIRPQKYGRQTAGSIPHWQTSTWLLVISNSEVAKIDCGLVPPCLFTMHKFFGELCIIVTYVHYTSYNRIRDSALFILFTLFTRMHSGLSLRLGRDIRVAYGLLSGEWRGRETGHNRWSVEFSMSQCAD